MAAAKKAAGSSRAITLHDHIKELRNRLFAVAIVFIVVSAVAYNYKDTLIYYLLKPLGDEKLIYLNPAGGFSFIFQVTMYVGIAAAVPFLIYNLYRFLAPALPERARKHSALVMLSSLFLLSVGVAFGYIFAIPGALNFLNHFAEGYIVPSLTADSYLNFILAYTAGLGILFQLPLALLLIHWIHPLTPKGLFKFERYMVLIAFVGAAMITPTPDVMNQLIIALPIIIMYQAGVIAVCISVAQAKRRARPPKMSRAEKKAQQNAAKLAKKQDKKKGRTRHAQPIPMMPEMSELLASVTHPHTALAAPSQATRMTRPIMDISGPVRPGSSPRLKSQPVASSQTEVASAPSPEVAALSQTRKTMDIMIGPSPIRQGVRGTITRPDRPVHHRTPALQVPQRARMTMPSIDGVSVIY